MDKTLSLPTVIFQKSMHRVQEEYMDVHVSDAERATLRCHHHLVAPYRAPRPQNLVASFCCPFYIVSDVLLWCKKEILLYVHCIVVLYATTCVFWKCGVIRLKDLMFCLVEKKIEWKEKNKWEIKIWMNVLFCLLIKD